MKPLGRKAYGSIGHLSNSRRGPADFGIHEGQERICTVRARDSKDRVILTEKLDGSNVAIARVDGKIIALQRAGFLASSSPFRQHHVFADWVKMNENRFCDVKDGESLHGEWLYQAHGTMYRLKDGPLVLFDAKADGERVPYDQFRYMADKADVPIAHPLSDGPPVTVDVAMQLLGTYGHHGAIDKAEGVVWRVERRGVFDFMAKYVRPDKIDGKYFPEISGEQVIYNLVGEDHKGENDGRR